MLFKKSFFRYFSTSKILSNQLISPKIAVLTFTNPTKRNPMSHDLLIELNNEFNQFVSSFEKNKSPSVIIIKSTGPVFSAGHDLKELKAFNSVQRQQLFDLSTIVMKKIRKMPQTIISQVNGIAAAAGCQFVSSCDLVVCSKESTFSCPGIKYGIFCTTPGIALTRSIKSPKLALEMLLTGRNITAEEALNYGMVNKVVESSKLEEETLKLAESIISNSAEILAIGKQAFYEQIEKNLDDAYTFGEKVMLKNLETDDSKEGVNAFIEKRLPKWKH